MFKITTTVPEVYDLLKAGYLEPRVFQFAGKSFMPTECNVSAVAPQGRVFEIGYRLIEGVPIAWNGEGLPPVGTACEILKNKTTWAWIKVRIIAHVTDDPRFNPIAIYIPEGDPSAVVGQAVAASFRPIRTAEQIAAEARVKAIAEMTEIAGAAAAADNPRGGGGAAALYDAGYRKVEK